jgi:hypothetical protein
MLTLGDADSRDERLPTPEIQHKTKPNCVSNKECEAGYSCWYRPPRGPLAGVPGSEKQAGTCWRNDAVLGN